MNVTIKFSLPNGARQDVESLITRRRDTDQLTAAQRVELAAATTVGEVADINASIRTAYCGPTNSSEVFRMLITEGWPVVNDGRLMGLNRGVAQSQVTLSVNASIDYNLEQLTKAYHGVWCGTYRMIVKQCVMCALRERLGDADYSLKIAPLLTRRLVWRP